ncbi:hypothetical protein ACKAV7_000312 [Fusarium commune]
MDTIAIWTLNIQFTDEQVRPEKKGHEMRHRCKELQACIIDDYFTEEAIQRRAVESLHDCVESGSRKPLSQNVPLAGYWAESTPYWLRRGSTNMLKGLFESGRATEFWNRETGRKELRWSNELVREFSIAEMQCLIPDRDQLPRWALTLRQYLNEQEPSSSFTSAADFVVGVGAQQTRTEAPVSRNKNRRPKKGKSKAGLMLPDFVTAFRSRETQAQYETQTLTHDRNPIPPGRTMYVTRLKHLPSMPVTKDSRQGAGFDGIDEFDDHMTGRFSRYSA